MCFNIRKKVFNKFKVKLKNLENGLKLKILNDFLKTINKFNNKNKKTKPLKIIDWLVTTFIKNFLY